MKMSKIKITEIHIDNDLVNKSPTIVYTDETGTEWVHEEQSSNFGGYITALVPKSKSWYFKSENNEVDKSK